MITLLRGTVEAKGKGYLTLLTPSGVGYEVRMSNLELTQYAVSEGTTIHTYLKVAEQALELYGFPSIQKREFFMKLLTVSGVGPKSAMNILALGSIDDIKSAIVRGDVKYLTAVQGMGKKTAERMVVELKSKIAVKDIGQDITGGILSEVMDGLVSMGDTRSEAKDVVQTLDPKGKDTETLLKEALKRN
ncbi:MAG: Holliday junction branch migration protein RuvA [Candidatus Magasanikbacteria bacterium]|nr:Holliday junction branch migration protein RuvA [Candidatus Magasanikbacteria bacterium]